MLVLELFIAVALGLVIGGGVMHFYMLRYHEMKMLAEADRQCATAKTQIACLRKDLTTMNSRVVALNGMVDANPWANPGLVLQVA